MRALRRFFGCTLFLLAAGVARGGDLERGFEDPPISARLRAYWWWLNGNVTKEAITRDLEWMKQIGMGGGLVFDAGGATQGGHAPVPAGPLFGSPEWRALFMHSLAEADRLGLEIGLNLQSGWNLGGPLVTPDRAAKAITWSTWSVQGPTNLSVALPAPKARDDFYRDTFLLAYRRKAGRAEPTPVLAASSRQADRGVEAMRDGKPETFWVSDGPATADKPQWVTVAFPRPVVLTGARVGGRPGYGPRDCEWQASEDGRRFTTVQPFAMEKDREAIPQFAATTASTFRLLIRSSYDPLRPESPRNVQIAELVLLDADAHPLGASTARKPIRQLAEKSAFHELGGSASDCAPLLEDDPAVPGEEDVAVKDVVDLSDRLGADGMLRWEAPAGDWEILRFGYTYNGAHVSTSSGAWTGRVLDYLDADAMRWYWQQVMDPIIAEGRAHCGKAWKMVQTDSWELGGVNWTAGFPGEFQRRRGYDLRPWLPVLAGRIVESRDASNRFLADWRRTIADCVADNHYGVMAKLAGAHGLGIQPESAGPHTAPLDGLMCYGRSTWPMSEFWVPSPHRPTDDRRFFVKQAASAAHIYGQPIVCAEGFTSIGPQWDDVLWSSQKPSFDHEACAGLNLVFWHAFTCSPREMGLPGQEYFAGTHFNPQITWAKQAPAFVSYLNRCQFLLQQGQFVGDVLYYYGNHVPNIARRKQDDPARVLPEYDYDVVNEEVLLRAEARDGRIVLPSGMSYRLLVLPALPAMSLEIARKLRALTAAGAVVLGPPPERTTGRQDDAELRRLAAELWGGGRVITNRSAKAALAGLGVGPDVEGIPDWIHRRDGATDIYFISNQRVEPFRGDLRFRVSGKQPEFWDAVSGVRRDAAAFVQADGRTTVPVELPPYGSLFVIFRRPAAGIVAGHNFPAFTKVAELSGPWDVTFDCPLGAPAARAFEQLTDWTRRPEEELRAFSGSATYRKTFDAPQAGGRLALDLGELSMLAEVRLNGRDLGVVWVRPFRVDITDAVKPAGNVLEVTVVNGWWNRILRDQALPTGQRLTQTNIRLKPGAQPQPSGLLGPVTLVQPAPVL